MLALSLIAPQQPRKPTRNMRQPTVSVTDTAATHMLSLRSLRMASMLVAGPSTSNQIVTPIRKPPSTYNKTGTTILIF